MVQLENEYGSYALQTAGPDTAYLIHLHSLLRHHLGPKVIIYSTDGCSSRSILNSRTAGVFSTVDFGPDSSPQDCFAYQTLFEPHGPLVNSEFYPGWLDHWGQPHSKVNTSSVVKTLDEMLRMGANVNIYLMHGGTSFGFTSGSNYPPFQPNPTSYDYDAPISEAGDLTEKYFAIQKVIAKYLPLPDLNVTSVQPKGT